jgi:hypothetical protein
MNGLLGIAESFLDRMTNPQYGAEVNDEYSLRFHQLLLEDLAFADSFARLALDPEDVGSLPICAWPWYLQWRAERAPPPSADFLDALFDSTDDPAVQMTVLQSALSDRDPETPSAQAARVRRDEEDGSPASSSGPDGSPASSSGPDGTVARYVPERDEPAAIQSPWLRARVTRLTGGLDLARSRTSAGEIATYLLQLGDPASLANLANLLDVQWAGRESLLDAIAGKLADADLDPETLARWRSQLGLARPGEGT